MVDINLFLQLVLRIWIKIKFVLGKLFKRIGRLAEEFDFVFGIEGIEFLTLKNKDVCEIVFDDNSRGYIDYAVDKLGKLIWDFQFDSKKMYIRGKADCNTLHRLVQVFNYVRDDSEFEEVYLVHYIAKPFRLSHGTVLAKKLDKWAVLDYNHRILFDTVDECLEYLCKKYKAEKIRAFCLQDIEWKTQNLKEVI